MHLLHEQLLHGAQEVSEIRQTGILVLLKWEVPFSVLFRRPMLYMLHFGTNNYKNSG